MSVGHPSSIRGDRNTAAARFGTGGGIVIEAGISKGDFVQNEMINTDVRSKEIAWKVIIASCVVCSICSTILIRIVISIIVIHPSRSCTTKNVRVLRLLTTLSRIFVEQHVTSLWNSGSAKYLGEIYTFVWWPFSHR